MRLAQKCRLVEGAKRAAIYDLESGNVYSLNETAKRIVEGETQDDRFWQKLLEVGLVEDEDGHDASLFDDVAPEIGLEYMCLELTENCNLRCIHCYACSSPLPKVKNLETKVWKKVIREAANLGCKSLQLSGGEAFTYRGILELATFAREIGYTFVEIFTNAMLLSHETTKMIKELGLHMAVSLYSNKPSIHEQITQIPASFERTHQGLQLLKEFDVPTRVVVIVMRQNQSTVVSTQRFIEKLGHETRKPDVVRPTGRGGSPGLLPGKEAMKKWGLMVEPDFTADKERFMRYRFWNGCWAGKIAVINSGDVVPCVFAREHIGGNILQTSFEEILFGKTLQKLWRITKDNVEVCKDCEYRYACRDCRALAEAETGNLRSKFPRCTYDPYTGQWG